jgi:hypothetical protein
MNAFMFYGYLYHSILALNYNCLTTLYSKDLDPDRNQSIECSILPIYLRADLLLGSSGGEPGEGEVEQGARTPRHQDCFRTAGQGRQPSNSCSSVTF